MGEKLTSEFTDEKLRESFDRANEFSQDEVLIGALNSVIREPELWEEASREPGTFLRSRGVEIPEGLGVTFIDDPTRGRPTPDFEFFTFRLFNCRTYWLKRDDGSCCEQVEICRGFEIVPNLPPGPPIA